ncbi:hypothetical protein B0H10DRAFT_1943642 [Mycena sp. CBHHK59/15]|nr:hypothetical protein B0H10DRAFT_1943642 [Mycena sp. CBHHK59/15]
MYPGSGGFSPAVRNLSNRALDYWIECNLASCIEFMYPGSAGLIVRLWIIASHKEVLRIWVTNEYLPDLYLVLFEAQNNLAPPRSALQMNNPPTRTLIQQLKLTSWQDGPEDRGCIDWVSRAWQTATSVWVLGTCGRGLATCDFCLGSGGLEVVARQAATFVWVLGLEVVAWQASTSVWASRGLSYGLCLGSGGLRSWFGKLRLLFGFWGFEAVAWQAATSVWASGGIGVMAWQASTSVWASGGTWVVAWQVAWQAATSVWVLGEQIEIWPGQAQLLSGQSRMLWADGNRTTWPVFLPLSWLHHGKQSAKLFA